MIKRVSIKDSGTENVYTLQMSSMRQGFAYEKKPEKVYTNIKFYLEVKENKKLLWRKGFGIARAGDEISELEYRRIVGTVVRSKTGRIFVIVGNPMAAWIGLAEINRGEIVEIPKPVEKLVLDRSSYTPPGKQKKLRTFITPPDEICAPVSSETGLKFVEASIDEATSTIHASFDKESGWEVTYNYKTEEWKLIR